MSKKGESKNWILKSFLFVKVLFRNVPTWVIVLFSLSIIGMNLLAQFVLVSLPWLALNYGIFVSWIVFLIMDVVTKHFGVKAANVISVFGLVVNSIAVLIFWLISIISSNPSLDLILHGQWSIWLASSIAFIVSAVLNNLLNKLIRTSFKNNPDGKVAYVVSSYVSTLVGQFVDNMLFVVLAFMVFCYIPGATPVFYTFEQCLGASLLCAVFELLFEVVFSPIGYKLIQHWRKNGVGEQYIEMYDRKSVTNEL